MPQVSSRAKASFRLPPFKIYEVRRIVVSLPSLLLSLLLRIFVAVVVVVVVVVKRKVCVGAEDQRGSRHREVVKRRTIAAS